MEELFPWPENPDELRPRPQTTWWVLTLTQPFATLAALGLKRNETRGRPTAYRGPLLIHAGLGPGYFGNEAALWEFCLAEPCRSALAAHGITSPGQLPRGQLLARVNLLDCVQTWPSWATVEPWFVGEHDGQQWPVPPAAGSLERAVGDYAPGRWAYLLAEPHAFAKPIPARGLPGFWRWSGAPPA